MVYFILETNVLILLLIFLGIVLGFQAFLIGLKLTSNISRDYSTLNPNDEINGQKVLEIVEKYKPIFYQEEHIKKDIQLIFYEAIDQKENLVLIYRPLWKDEIHPNFFLNLIYKYYRWYYYNSIKDIEFVEMVIDKQTGDIQSFSFEALAEGSSINAPKHEFTNIIKKGEDFLCTTKNNALIDVLLEKAHIVFQVNTWNHLLLLGNKPDGKKFDSFLYPLTNKLYRRSAISRRSSGYIKTKTNRTLTILTSFSLLIIFGVALPIVLYYLLG